MVVWVKASLVAWLVSLDSTWATVGKDFEEPAMGGRALSGRSRGVTGFRWTGFAVGSEALAGAG